jgi:arabinogalactan oligomer / maltooligosaccharide transport system substrate-binding protein
MHRLMKTGAAVAGLALALSACSSGDSSTTSEAPATSAAAVGGTLLIWADNSANVAKTLAPLCEQWATDNGVTCKVQKFADAGTIRTQVVQGNSSGKVPDIFVGAHDWLGELVKNGVVSPVDISANQANFSQSAIQASTYEGQNYGVPWAVENVALLMNKKLSSECPATLDDAVSTGQKLVDDGKATLGIALQIGTEGDAYHWQPLYSASGGYVFKQNADGTYDPADLGVGQQGSIDAATALQKMADEKVIKASVTYDIARETFAKGKAPYFITGPWQIDEQSKALGDDLTVCPVPNWNGSQYTSQPWVGVQMFFRSQKAPNGVLADTFLNDEVMTTEFMDSMFAGDGRPPAWNESYAKAATDPILKAFGDYGATGLPLPAIPEMASVWADLGLAEFKVASGDDPEKTMVAAGQSITKSIASAQ